MNLYINSLQIKFALYSLFHYSVFLEHLHETQCTKLID